MNRFSFLSREPVTSPANKTKALIGVLRNPNRNKIFLPNATKLSAEMAESMQYHARLVARVRAIGTFEQAVEELEIQRLIDELEVKLADPVVSVVDCTIAELVISQIGSISTHDTPTHLQRCFMNARIANLHAMAPEDHSVIEILIRQAERAKERMKNGETQRVVGLDERDGEGEKRKKKGKGKLSLGALLRVWSGKRSGGDGDEIEMK